MKENPKETYFEREHRKVVPHRPYMGFVVGEKWLPISGFEHYSISNQGRVKSATKELAIYTHKKHPQVCLIKNRKSFWLQLNQLVAKHFVENTCRGQAVRHKDSNPLNCAANNLEWVSKGFSKIKYTPDERSERKRNTFLKHHYGIGTVEYDTLLLKQGGCCAVCLKPSSAFTKRLAVDHDHKSGRIRGLLCTFCNRTVIGRHRDPELLKRAGCYLEQGTEWFVPQKKKTRKRRKRAPTKTTKRTRRVVSRHV